MNTALRITPFTPKLGRTTRIKRASKKDDTFLDTHDDKPVYVTRLKHTRSIPNTTI